MTGGRDVARATVSVAQAAVETADFARGIVGSIDRPQAAVDAIREGRRLRLFALAVLDRIVIAQRVAGASWADIAAGLGGGWTAGTVEAKYGPDVETWCGRRPITDHSMLVGDSSTGMPWDLDLDGTADAIDLWYARHAEPWEQPAGPGQPGPCTRALHTTL